MKNSPVTTIKTKINGYIVELTIDESQDPPTHCRVSCGNLSASLNYLNQTGCLYDYHMIDVPVRESTVEKILDWAEENGY